MSCLAMCMNSGQNVSARPKGWFPPVIVKMVIFTRPRKNAVVLWARLDSATCGK